MRDWKLPAIVGALGLAASVLFALNYPAVELLGTKVRLPVFHGASTWANLMIFGGMLISAILYIKSGADQDYNRSFAFRVVAISMWSIGTILGFLAAFNTWDFTGAVTPAWQLMMEDPRLVIQVVVTLLGFGVLVVPLIVESKRGKAWVDAAFVLVVWIGLLVAMNAGSDLHPDSPVMNSDEFLIKALFFAMVLGQLVMGVGFAAAVTQWTNARLSSSEK